MIDLMAARRTLENTPKDGHIEVTRRWLEQAIAEIEAARLRDPIGIYTLDVPPQQLK